MFTKSKISQSMIDAVSNVIAEEDKKLLLEPEKKSTKIATTTGTKVLGHRYGNSAKAHKDQTSHEIDKVKEPKAKDLAKESFEDEHGISDKTFKNKLVNKVKKSMKEGKGNGPQETFTDNNIGEAHVETTHKSPAKGTDLADKSYLKDIGKKPTVKSDLKNLGRFLTGKKETNEEVTTDMIKGRESGGKSNSFKGYKVTLKDGEKIEVPTSEETGEDTPARNSIKAKLSTTISQMHKEEAILDEMINEVMAKDASAGDWIKDFTDSENPKFAGKSKKKRKEMALAAYYSKKNEEDELDEAVSRKDFQMVADLIKTHDDHGKRKELAQHHAEIFHRQNPRFDRSKFMKAANVTEETVSEGRMKDIATGKEEDERLSTWKKETPWKDSKETITDKSGAKHTPMSRAKDLARSAFKKLQKETMMGKISN